MSARPLPTVYLKIDGNPWKGILSDNVVQRLLREVALEGEEKIKGWIADGKAESYSAFVQVFLDPTNPRDQWLDIFDRIFAVVVYGDLVRALDYLPGAVAMADAADRHGGRSNRELIDRANFCLGDGDSTRGHSVSYEGAISAGSGLSADLDRDLAQFTLERVMRAIHSERVRWLEARRLSGRPAVWYNEGDAPGKQYRFNLLHPGDWLQSPSS